MSKEEKVIEKIQCELNLARDCALFCGFRCNNTSCKNYFCVLNPTNRIIIEKKNIKKVIR